MIYFFKFSEKFHENLNVFNVLMNYLPSIKNYVILRNYKGIKASVTSKGVNLTHNYIIKHIT